MSYNCIIIDDEPIAHDILIQYISKNERMLITSQFYNTSDAAFYLKNNTVDILFLDIQMPGVDGISFLQSLDIKPITIMTTAFREFALEGFDLGVMDYLIKPIKEERFALAVNRAIEFLDLQKNNESLIEEANAKEIKSFVIKSGTKLISLPIDSVTHVQGLKDYAIIFSGEKKFVIKGYIKTVESILPKGFFTRVHKSFIVANSKIKIINRNRIEFENYQIPIGRIYKKIVDSLM
jgi:DNA-binding LytR/AlgR family response regulator